MSDLIRREDAVSRISDLLMIELQGKRLPTWNEVYHAINDIPSAEPEPKIIHCKDCKFYTPMNRKLKTGICSMTMHHLGDDGFCSTAEKRGKND